MSESADSQSRPQFTRPTIPTLQTTADGRVGIGSKGQQENGQISFRLLVPEKVEQPFIVSEVGTGTDILALPNQLAPGVHGFPGSSLPGSGSSHVTLCDASFDPQSSVKNPRACGVNNADDCYDINIIRTDSQAGSPRTRTIFGIPVTVRVSNPKTVNARIVETTLSGPAVTGPTHTINAFFEPMTTADGRLLMARVNAGSQFTWTDSAGSSRTTNSDIVYFVNDNPDAFEACDVRQWDKIYPVTHAPYDTTINQRYGFAMQLFRDSMNNVIPDGISLGTYGWIDKDGDNISFTTLGTRLYNYRTGNVTDADLDPQCVSNVCDANLDSANGGSLNGRAMMGLWTRGKMVLLDNLVNNIDYTTHGDDAGHRTIQLYSPGQRGDGRVRIGNGRDNREELLPLGSSGTTTFFDTNEHRFNYLPNMRPVTPADVTWLISSGRGTHEVPFDDYLNPDSFIFANMAQPVEITDNGVRRVVEGRLQNAATGGKVTLIQPSLPASGSQALNGEWRIPDSGVIMSGNGRVEPVAIGGMHGKGFWVDGDGDGIAFTIPAQTRSLTNRNWYYGLYVDARGNQAGDRALLRYPDRSEIQLREGNIILFTNARGDVLHRYTINEPVTTHSWRHYGFQINNQRNRSTQITTYLNGFQVDNVTLPQSTHQLAENADLVVAEGAQAGDLRGWIDEFKVIAGVLNPEVACNQASGTMVGMTNRAPTHWAEWANSVPAAVHQEISARLAGNNRPTFSRYACFHNYDDDYAAHMANIPARLTGIRESMNFPEGPLVADQPRPDSSNNAFCLSCHTADGGDGLSIGALTLNARLDATDDPRRQPTQPDPKVYGNIPAN